MEKPRLLDQVRHKLRLKHYSLCTERTYVHWIKHFILFHNKRHPSEMGAPEVEAFLTYLAVKKRVSASTQNQALNSIVFLYKHKNIETTQLYLHCMNTPGKKVESPFDRLDSNQDNTITKSD